MFLYLDLREYSLQGGEEHGHLDTCGCLLHLSPGTRRPGLHTLASGRSDHKHEQKKTTTLREVRQPVVSDGLNSVITNRPSRAHKMFT